MNKTSTINPIIKYLYGELPPKSSIRWTERIMANDDLMEEFEALAEMKNLIEKSKLLSPTQGTLKSIMAEVSS